MRSYDCKGFLQVSPAMRDKNCCVYRNTEGMPPEYATDHTTHFSVCTYFATIPISVPSAVAG